MLDLSAAFDTVNHDILVDLVTEVPSDSFDYRRYILLLFFFGPLAQSRRQKY